MLAALDQLIDGLAQTPSGAAELPDALGPLRPLVVALLDGVAPDESLLRLRRLVATGELTDQQMSDVIKLLAAAPESLAPTC